MSFSIRNGKQEIYYYHKDTGSFQTHFYTILLIFVVNTVWRLSGNESCKHIKLLGISWEESNDNFDAIRWHMASMKTATFQCKFLSYFQHCNCYWNLKAFINTGEKKQKLSSLEQSCSPSFPCTNNSHFFLLRLNLLRLHLLDWSIFLIVLFWLHQLISRTLQKFYYA